jgi:trimeric autotransporter adhesin
MMSSLSVTSNPLSPSSSSDSSTVQAKTRSSRLNERIQRARRHRQWLNQSSATPAAESVQSTESPVSSPSSKQDDTRAKITKMAEQYQRQRKMQSPHSPSKLSHPQGGGGTVLNQNQNAKNVSIDSNSKNLQDVKPEIQRSQSEDISSSAIVAWPDDDEVSQSDNLPETSTALQKPWQKVSRTSQNSSVLPPWKQTPTAPKVLQQSLRNESLREHLTSTTKSTDFRSISMPHKIASWKDGGNSFLQSDKEIGQNEKYRSPKEVFRSNARQVESSSTNNSTARDDIQSGGSHQPWSSRVGLSPTSSISLDIRLNNALSSPLASDTRRQVLADEEYPDPGIDFDAESDIWSGVSSGVQATWKRSDMSFLENSISKEDAIPSVYTKSSVIARKASYELIAKSPEPIRLDVVKQSPWQKAKSPSTSQIKSTSLSNTTHNTISAQNIHNVPSTTRDTIIQPNSIALDANIPSEKKISPLQKPLSSYQANYEVSPTSYASNQKDNNTKLGHAISLDDNSLQTGNKATPDPRRVDAARLAPWLKSQDISHVHGGLPSTSQISHTLSSSNSNKHLTPESTSSVTNKFSQQSTVEVSESNSGKIAPWQKHLPSTTPNRWSSSTEVLRAVSPTSIRSGSPQSFSSSKSLHKPKAQNPESKHDIDGNPSPLQNPQTAHLNEEFSSTSFPTTSSNESSNSQVPHNPKAKLTVQTSWSSPKSMTSPNLTPTQGKFQSGTWIKSSTAAHAPYSNNRQARAEMPPSPSKPTDSNAIKTPLTGSESPAQMWKRREEEMKNSASFQGNSSRPRTPINLNPSFLSPSSDQAKVKAQSLNMPSTPVANRPADNSNLTSSIPLNQAHLTPKSTIKDRPDPEAKMTFTTKQLPLSKKESPFGSYAPSALKKNAQNDLVNAEIRESFGGAVIETPKSQSVSSLRASFGARPSPPPFMNSAPTLISSSPRGNTWTSNGKKQTPTDPPSSRITKEKKDLDVPRLLERDNEDFSPRKFPLQDPLDNSSVIRSSAFTPRVSNNVVIKETDSDATPVISHRGPLLGLDLMPRMIASPSKSLAEMATDSLVITDFSQYKVKINDEATDDEESMLSGGIGPITPSHADLPTEFRTILQQLSHEEVASIKSVDAMDNDQPISIDRSKESSARRHTLVRKLEQDGFSQSHQYASNAIAAAPMKSAEAENFQIKLSEEEERMSKNINDRNSLKFLASTEIWQSDGSQDLRPQRFSDFGSSKTSTEETIKIQPSASEFKEAGSSAVFGNPSTWGHAGGEEPIDAPSVSERARAISMWNGGLQTPERDMRAVDVHAPVQHMMLEPIDTGYSKTIEPSSLGEPILSRQSASSQMPFHSPGNASRILAHFSHVKKDEFNDDDEMDWASRDPDLDIDIMRDDSPSPEPENEDHQQYSIDGSHSVSDTSASDRKSVHKVRFANGAEDPFTTGGSVPVENSNQMSLNPEDVFGNFWSTASVDESIEFDEGNLSFFDTNPNYKGTESPFRVVLKPPRKAPPTRMRRKKEALDDYEARYAKYISELQEWKQSSEKGEI